MGETREALADRTPVTGRSPLVPLAEAKERLFDHLQRKKQELETEGEPARERNQRDRD